MSRTPRDTVLPLLRTSYAEDYGRDIANYSPRKDIVTDRGISRMDVLEDRLSLQEKNTHALLERAYKVKEDILENLNYTHGTWADEKHARQLLHEHIRTITEVVRKLSRDIQLVEENIKAREYVTEGANNAVKNLEVHHVAGLTEVRGRVARCDASISRLSSDLKTCYESIKLLSSQMQENNNRVMDRLQHLDAKITETTGRLDKYGAEQTMRIKMVEGDSSQQVSTLDAKTHGLFSETRSAMNTQRALEESEREKLETRLLHTVDKVNNEHYNRQDKYERKVNETLISISKQLSKLEEELFKEKDRTLSNHQTLQSKVQTMIDNADKVHTEDMNKLKRECREGFSTVHETISNMKTVTDGKRKLLEEQMRKEIGQIRKMVVLI